MANPIPTHIRDGDHLLLRRSRPKDSRLVYTFVDALNQGTLFERPPSIFSKGASQHRLFELINLTKDETLIGTIIVQDNYSDDRQRTRESELGGLVVHPGARGWRLAGLLTRLSLLHDLTEGTRQGWSTTYQAHFAEGNSGPEVAFRQAGFRAAGYTKVHRGDVDASIQNMIHDGEDSVTMKRLVFDPANLDGIIAWYHDLSHSGTVTPADGQSTVRVELGSLAEEIDTALIAN